MSSAFEALRSLQRCRPAGPPVYRDGDVYELDVHDDELDLWLFRLGVRGPKVPRLNVRRPPERLPDPETPLTTSEIEKAFRDANLYGWSAQRLALAVLDCHGGRMPGPKVVEAMKQLTKECSLDLASADRWRAMAVIVETDGSWRLNPDHEALRSTRKAVRERIEKRPLADLGPPRKSYSLNRRRRTLRITTELLIQGSCGITTPFGDPRKLTTYLSHGRGTRWRRGRVDAGSCEARGPGSALSLTTTGLFWMSGMCNLPGSLGLAARFEGSSKRPISGARSVEPWRPGIPRRLRSVATLSEWFGLSLF